MAYAIQTLSATTHKGMTMDNLKRLFVNSELRGAIHPVIGKQWIESTEIDEMVYVVDNCSYSTFKALLEIDSNYGGAVKLKLMSITHNNQVIEVDSLQSSKIIALAKNAFFDTVGDGCDYPCNLMEG